MKNCILIIAMALCGCSLIVQDLGIRDEPDAGDGGMVDAGEDE